MRQQLESTNRALKISQNELLLNHIPKQDLIGGYNSSNSNKRNPSPSTKRRTSNSPTISKK